MVQCFNLTAKHTRFSNTVVFFSSLFQLCAFASTKVVSWLLRAREGCLGLSYSEMSDSRNLDPDPGSPFSLWSSRVLLRDSRQHEKTPLSIAFLDDEGIPVVSTWETKSRCAWKSGTDGKNPDSTEHHVTPRELYCNFFWVWETYLLSIFWECEKWSCDWGTRLQNFFL